MENRWAVVVLAAGESLRMGRMKASLDMYGASSFLEHILTRYERAGCQHMQLVLNQAVEKWWKINLQKDWPGVQICQNTALHKGMLHSAMLGLRGVPGHQDVFIHKVDSPLVNPEVLQQMLAVIEPGSWVKPVYRGTGGHPVLLSARVVSSIVDQPIAAGTLKELLANFPVKEIEVDSESILWNIDTPEDYQVFLDVINPKK